MLDDNMPMSEKDLVHTEAKELMNLLQTDSDQGVKNFVNSLRVLVGEEALQDTVKWLSGDSAQPPTAVRLISSNISQKVDLLNILVMMQNLQRTQTLVSFLQEAEASMFNKQMLVALDTHEFLKVYDSAQKSLSNILDFSRKYLQQNKAVATQSQEMNEIIDMLLSLSPENYDKLKGLLKDPSLKQS